MESSNFIFNEIDKDIENGVCPADGIITRFPPEPNGYLHIGHAKAICIDFGVKEKYPGTRTNLRFDDTNPAKEDTEYTQSIQEDIKWLGFEWDGLFYASDYFGKMYEYAKELIKKGLAYVDDQTQEQIKQTRGSLTEKGSDSPYRTRSAEENLALFVKMKEGAFAEGERVLRAKIDMASPNINMRDPVIYRILYASHHNTGNEWCIYPMYDYAHPIEDAIEGITHSLCTLEFEDHRPFYDWLLSNLDDYKIKRPRQIEFARLNLSGTVTSKRYLKQLVDNGVADGWDDPRMPTLCGLRRRGVVPEAIRDFCASVGTAKANSTLEMGQFEYFIRNALMPASLRVMAVLDPIKLTITNYPDGESEMLEIPYIMDDENSPARKVPFSSHLLIERSDFMAEPVKKYFRLFPGNEVRLMGAYFVTCTDYKTDANGNVTEVFATYDPETKSGSGFNARKVKGTIHWVDETAALRAEVRLYDDMFTKIEGDDSPNVNASFEKVVGYIEPSVKGVKKAERFQFVRNGFFCCDTKDSTPDAPVFNRTLGLKSSWKPEKTEQ